MEDLLKIFVQCCVAKSHKRCAYNDLLIKGTSFSVFHAL